MRKCFDRCRESHGLFVAVFVVVVVVVAVNSVIAAAVVSFLVWVLPATEFVAYAAAQYAKNEKWDNMFLIESIADTANLSLCIQLRNPGNYSIEIRPNLPLLDLR